METVKVYGLEVEKIELIRDAPLIDVHLAATQAADSPPTDQVFFKIVVPLSESEWWRVGEKVTMRLDVERGGPKRAEGCTACENCEGRQAEGCTAANVVCRRERIPRP